MKAIAYAVMFCTLACACAAHVKQVVWVEFAVTSPNHVTDWQQARTALQTAGIGCQDGASDLGAFSFSVASNDFDHAKEIVAELIRSKSLTLRVKKQKDSPLFEIYKDGKKVAEERHSIHDTH